MTKAELESKHLADLHALAAEAGVERYRMLTRGELIERLAEPGGSGAGSAGASRGRATEGEQRERAPRRRRRRRGGSGQGGRSGSGAETDQEAGSAAVKSPEPEPRQPERQPESVPPERAPAPIVSDAATAAAEPAPRPRRRRRRRFGRRGKQGVTLQGLLLPPETGRQAVLLAESREACTALLHSVAADLAADSKGPDPVALLIDPSPEELADWKRDAPQAEIVAAGQPRHADDALAQAVARANGGEDVILLVDSLTRLGEAYGDAEAAKDFFDAGRQATTGSGSLTVVAALERPA